MTADSRAIMGAARGRDSDEGHWLGREERLRVC
jgi:hypothetical protein